MKKELFTPFLVWSVSAKDKPTRDWIQNKVYEEDIFAIWGYLKEFFEDVHGFLIHTSTSKRVDGLIDYQIDDVGGMMIDNGSCEYTNTHEAMIECSHKAFQLLNR